MKSSKKFVKKNKISIIIPSKNEELNIPLLYKELHSVCVKFKSYEIIFVNDGSTDKTQLELERLFIKNPNNVKVIQFFTNIGKASALQAGFDIARGDILITLDADLQDDPAEIPEFIKKINEGYDAVIGWKQNRHDPIIKVISSKLFNTVNSHIFNTRLHDMNCGLKAIRSDAAEGLKIYGELHRYIPVLLSTRGYRVTELPVHHRPRRFGKTKYGPIRFLSGFIDLVTVYYLTRFRSRPLHLYAYIGFSIFSIGFLFAIYLTYIKLFEHQAIGNRPLLLLSVMLMIMGFQISLVGLVDELITSQLLPNDPFRYAHKRLGKNKQ